MASNYHHHHHHHHPHSHSHHHQPSPSPPCTHCYCNPPSYTCCTTPPPPPPPPQDHHDLAQAITSLLSQPHPTAIPSTHHYHYPKSPSHNILTQTHNHQNQHQTLSTISSLLHRIQSLESSLSRHSLLPSSPSSSLSLRHAAARVIQTHFRSFLVRRSRTLRNLRHLALIKSTFTSLKSSLSQNALMDFPALSLKAFNLLLELDSIEDCDPMVLDGKRSISRDLVQFLDSIEGAAVRKHVRCVKAAKSGRVGQTVNKSRYSCEDDERRKLLQNLRGRVERISRLCKASANDDEGLEHDGVHHVGGGGGDYDYDGGDGDTIANILISRRNEVSPKKNGVFVQRQGVQPRVKKCVTFAENGKIREVYRGDAYEPDLSGEVACLDGSSSSDDQGEVLENVSCAVEDGGDSSQGAEDDEEAFVESEGSPHSSDDGGRNSRRGIKNDGRSIVKGQLQAHQEKLLFSAPLPLKMENKSELMKSKGVRILT